MTELGGDFTRTHSKLCVRVKLTKRNKVDGAQIYICVRGTEQCRYIRTGTFYSLKNIHKNNPTLVLSKTEKTAPGNHYIYVHTHTHTERESWV